MASIASSKVKVGGNGSSTKQAPLTLDSLIKLGDTLRDKGKLNEASEFYYKSLYSREKALGFDHPSTLEAVNSLALLLELKRNFSEAENMFLRCFEGRKKMLGNNDPSTCEVAFNLGELYRKLNRNKQAIEMYEYAHDGYLISLGPEHKNTLLCESRVHIIQTSTSILCEYYINKCIIC